MASLRISQLANLIGTDVSPGDLLAIVDMSASETKNIDVTNLAQAIGPLFPDGSIPGAKVDFTVPAGSIGTTELADGSVTAIKLANSSSGLYGPRPAAGSHIGQICVDNGYAYMWDGGSWKPVDGPNAIIGITYDDGPVQISVTSIENNVAKVQTAFVDSTVARQFVAGPTAAAGAVTYRQIVGADLPTAGPLEQGAVQVSGSGLTMNGTLLEIDNTIAPSSGQFFLVDYDANGLVVDSRAIEAGDLPLATDLSPGVVRPGTGLTVDNSGALNHTNVAVGGTYTKVVVDSEGHVSNGGNIDAADIPPIPADQIHGGTLDPQVIGEDSIDSSKMADYSTCLIQASQPIDGEYIGRFWLNPDTAQLYAFARGSAQDYWTPVGFGRLAQENLRFCGTFDATTSQITTLTEYGVQAGLSIGSIPNATTEITGVYLLCITPGNGVTVDNINGKSITEGDWIVAVNEAWEFINVGQGSGGGGGGANVLNDLLDVQVETVRSLGQAGAMAQAGYVLQDGDVLTYDAMSGLWKNKPPADVPVPENTSDLNNDGEDGSNPFVTQADIDASIVAADIPEKLADLSDVSPNTPPGNGNVLTWNGSTWVDVAAPPADISNSSIKQLNDVADGMVPTDGDVLTWDGSEWTSEPPADTMPEPDSDGVYLRKAEGSTYTWEDAEPLFIPMNDWSGIPQRTTVRATPPPPPTPTPEPDSGFVDPGFGVNPILSGGLTGSGGPSSAGTVDIVDLGETDE